MASFLERSITREWLVSTKRNWSYPLERTVRFSENGAHLEECPECVQFALHIGTGPGRSEVRISNLLGYY